MSGRCCRRPCRVVLASGRLNGIQDEIQEEKNDNGSLAGMSDPPPPIEDRAHVVLAVTIAFLAASSFFIILRFVSRIGIVKRVSADDYAIIVAWVSQTGVVYEIKH